VACGRQADSSHRLLLRSEALRGSIFRFRSTDAELAARSNSTPVRGRGLEWETRGALRRLRRPARMGPAGSTGAQPAVPEHLVGARAGHWPAALRQPCVPRHHCGARRRGRVLLLCVADPRGSSAPERPHSNRIRQPPAPRAGEAEGQVQLLVAEQRVHERAERVVVRALAARAGARAAARGVLRQLAVAPGLGRQAVRP